MSPKLDNLHVFFTEQLRVKGSKPAVECSVGDLITQICSYIPLGPVMSHIHLLWLLLIKCVAASLRPPRRRSRFMSRAAFRSAARSALYGGENKCLLSLPRSDNTRRSGVYLQEYEFVFFFFLPLTCFFSTCAFYYSRGKKIICSYPVGFATHVTEK